MNIPFQTRRTGSFIIFIFIFSCNTPGQPVIQKDSTKNDTATSALVAGDNEVKSEAPDASTKMEQGYAMPRNNDKLVQSPVNILTDSAINNNTQEIFIKFNNSVAAVENLGHTVQIDFNDGSTALAGGKTYSSKQFHFHTPSEHLIDGMTFPMEMHVVNILKDSNKQNSPQYLVVGFLFKMGRENKFIKEFLNRVPREEGKDTLAAGTVRFEDLFATIPKNAPVGYYAYR